MTTEQLKNNLIEIETRLGGVHRVPPGIHSPLDPREKFGNMRGGDRMVLHGYADIYAKHLIRFIGQSPVIVEIGVLKGTGLKMWRRLFPQSRIIGLDIDLSNCALSDNDNIELYEFDQFKPDMSFLKSDKADIVIDDGCHIDEAILKTWEAFKPHLADSYVYFVEDNVPIQDQLPIKDYDGRIAVL